MNTAPIYLDYAATTPLRKEVKERMMEVMDGPFGNPSSTHQFGRKSRTIVEECRKYIAKSFNCSPAEVIFTSGGTEADNAALFLSIRDLGVKRIITSAIEHHAILHTAESMQRNYDVEVEFVKLLANGNPDLNHLEELLKNEKPTLVSLMHANNELGNLLDLTETGRICHQYKAYFHSDTVQSIGQLPLDLTALPIDLISASAHKFYGPKGVGFLYMSSAVKTASFITGGAQERNMRGGTENVIGLAGMHTAIKYKLENLEEEGEHVKNMKVYLLTQLTESFGDQVQFNGLSADLDNSLHKILSVSFPKLKNDMLLFTLDLKGIAVSGGSACASGSLKGSHVISTILPDSDYPVVRFSFGKNTTIEELDRTMDILKTIIK